MIGAGQGQRILWLVRWLTAIGLFTVLITIGLVGWTLTKVRSERVRAAAEQVQLNGTSQGLRDRALDYRRNIRAVLDESAGFPARNAADSGLAMFVRSRIAQPSDAEVLLLSRAFQSAVVAVDGLFESRVRLAQPLRRRFGGYQAAKVDGLCAKFDFPAQCGRVDR